jgi:fatty acid desaturase
MPFWAHLMLTIVRIGMAGVGMNVMHDGNHGSYSTKNWVNKFMGGTIYVLAGNVYNWQVQHNVLHHTYTNIPGHDEDLDAENNSLYKRQNGIIFMVSNNIIRFFLYDTNIQLGYYN